MLKRFKRFFVLTTIAALMIQLVPGVSAFKPQVAKADEPVNKIDVYPEFISGSVNLAGEGAPFMVHFDLDSSNLDDFDLDLTNGRQIRAKVIVEDILTPVSKFSWTWANDGWRAHNNWINQTVFDEDSEGHISGWLGVRLQNNPMAGEYHMYVSAGDSIKNIQTDNVSVNVMDMSTEGGIISGSANNDSYINPAADKIVKITDEDGSIVGLGEADLNGDFLVSAPIGEDYTVTVIEPDVSTGYDIIGESESGIDVVAGEITSSVLINVDDIKPVISNVNLGNWYKNGAEATISAKITDLESGVAPVLINVDNVGSSLQANNSIKSSSGIYTWKFHVNQLVDGKYSFTISASDKAGNDADDLIGEIIVDNTAPLGTFTVNEDQIATTDFNVKLNLEVTDNLSGVEKVYISNENDLSKATELSYTDILDWQLPQLNGNYTVYVWLQDKAGNISNVPLEDSISLIGNPISSAQKLADYQLNKEFNISYDSTQDEIDYVELYYRLNGGVEWTKYVTLANKEGKFVQSPIKFTALEDGQYDFYTVATDKAGNKEDAPVDANGIIIPDATTKVDTVVPGAVTGLKAVVGDGRVVLSWDMVDGADGYKVSYLNTTIDVGNQNQTTIINLTNDTDYSFSVVAYRTIGNRVSALSSVKATPQAPQKATAPQVIPVAEAAEEEPVSAPAPTIQKQTVDKVETPSESIESDDQGDVKGEETTETKNWTTTIVILSILVILAAAVTGYYGYEWWATKPKKSNSKKKKNIKNKKDNSRW